MSAVEIKTNEEMENFGFPEPIFYENILNSPQSLEELDAAAAAVVEGVTGVIVNGHFVDDSLDTAQRLILDEYTFGESGALAIKTDDDNGLFLTPDGLLLKKEGDVVAAMYYDGTGKVAVELLEAGTIKSKQIFLGFTDNEGDCFIAAGKTDFDHDETGFIFGIDDSDSNKVKVIIGTPTEYLFIDGSTMYNTLRVGGYTPGSATLISSDAEKSDATVEAPTIMKQIKMGRDGTYRVSWQMRCVNTQPDSRHCYWQLNRGGYWNGDVVKDVSTSISGYGDSGWFDIPGTPYADGSAVYNQSFYLFGYADGGVTCYVRNFRIKVNAVNEVAAPSVIVA